MNKEGGHAMTPRLVFEMTARSMLGVTDREANGAVGAFPQAPEAIELRHLRSFVAVAEELNYTRAAARLYLSRPALSRQVSTLERLVGVQLLRRSTHRVELTIAGEGLLERARSVLADVDAAVRMTQSVGGELVGRIARMWGPIADQFSADEDIDVSRRAFESLHARFAPPEGVDVRPVNAGGVHALVLSPPEPVPLTTLHLHGGVHVMGSAFGYRHLAGALAVATETAVVLPDYRLAPEYPFPADVDDSVVAFGWMLNQGADPACTTIIGDSTGASLALAALMVMRDRGLPLPGRVVLLSPSSDLNWPCKDEATAAVLPRLHQWTSMYLDGHAIDDPILNPCSADLSGLPPMLIQTSIGGSWLEHACRLTENALSCGVEAHLEIYATDMHGFQFFWSFLPEAADAVNRVGEFCKGQFGASPR